MKIYNNSTINTDKGKEATLAEILASSLPVWSGGAY